VICVVTTGQAWQFRPYKWQDPKVLFRNCEYPLLGAIQLPPPPSLDSADGIVIVQGVYFQWNNEPVNPTVKEWNVKEMRVGPSYSFSVQESS
jgi:parafibromin